MKYVAPVASSVGWELEDMAAATGILGDAGIDASQAGTTLRTAVTKLAAPTDKAKKTMNEYGIELQNADGTMKSLPEIMASMESGFGNLTEAERAAAMQSIFGQEAMSGMLKLMENPEELRTYTEELENSGGTAKRVAEEQLDNLNGALTKINSAFESASISIGDALVPAIQKLAGWLQQALDWFNGLSESTRQNIAITAAITSVVLTFGGALLMLIGFLPQIIAGFKSMGIVMLAARTGIVAVAGALKLLMFNPIGIAIMAVIAAIVLFNTHGDAMKAKLASWGITMENFRNFIDKAKTAFTNLWTAFTQTEAFQAMSTVIMNLVQKFKDLAIGIKEAITTGDFTPLINAVKNLIPTMIGLLIGGVPRMIMAGIQLIQGLSNGTGQSIPELIAKAGEIVTSFLERLITQIPQFIQTGVEFVTSLLQGVAQTMPQVVQSVLKIITTFVETYASMLPQLIQSGIQSLSALLDGIVQALPQIATTITTVITTLVQMIVTLLPQVIQAGVQILQSVIEGIAQIIPQLVQSALTIITTIVESLIGMLPQLIESGIQILNAVIDGIIQLLPQLIQTAVEVLNTLIETIVSNLPMVIDAGIQILNAIVDGLIQLLPLLISTAVDLIMAIVDALVSSLPMIIDAGIQILMALIDGIIQILPQLVQAALDLILAIVDAIVGALPQIIDAGMQILSALIDGIIQILPELVSAILELIVAIVGALIDALPELVDAGNQLITALIDGVLQLLGEVGQAAWEIGQEIFNTISEVDLLDVGKDLIRGLWNGISSMSSWVNSKISGFSEGVLKGIKGFFDINSPSRVFNKEIGQNLVRGMDAGIDKLKRVPQKTMAKVSQNVMTGVDAVQGAFRNLSGMKVDSPRVGSLSGGRLKLDEFPEKGGNGGNNGDGGNSYNAPLVSVDNMNVRDDRDVRNVSKELYNLQRNHDRSQGGR